MGLNGRCRCGAVAYSVALEALPPTYACHCLDCQTWSGSAFALHALLPASLIEIAGETAEYVSSAGEAMVSRHWFCPLCATRIANENGAVPGMLILRAGTLERSGELAPVAHIWTRRKQPWIAIPPSIATFEESPTPEQFGAALANATTAT